MGVRSNFVARAPREGGKTQSKLQPRKFKLRCAVITGKKCPEIFGGTGIKIMEHRRRDAKLVPILGRRFDLLCCRRDRVDKARIGAFRLPPGDCSADGRAQCQNQSAMHSPECAARQRNKFGFYKPYSHNFAFLGTSLDLGFQLFDDLN